MIGAPGFFDFDDRLKRLSDLGDHLEAFRSAVDFEMFRADLVAALAYSDGAQGGRPPFDPVMMFAQPQCLRVAFQRSINGDAGESLSLIV